MRARRRAEWSAPQSWSRDLGLAEVLQAGGQLLGFQQDLVGEGVLGGLGHVEVLEGVELPHTCGGGDGEQEAAGLGVGVGRPELDPAEGEARDSWQGERSSDFWICSRVFVSAGFVTMYLSLATLHICFIFVDKCEVFC